MARRVHAALALEFLRAEPEGARVLLVIRAATLKGAEALGREREIGSVEVGKLADLVVVEENPLGNLKVLYGTGAIRLSEENKPIRVGGVALAVKDGILYDAKKLLADVRAMVAAAKLKATSVGVSIAPPFQEDP